MPAQERNPSPAPASAVTAPPPAAAAAKAEPPMTDLAKSSLDELQNQLLSQVQAPSWNLTKVESERFVIQLSNGDTHELPILSCLYTGLLETRNGRPWDLYRLDGTPLLNMNAQRQLNGDMEFATLFQRYENQMLLEHLTSAFVALRRFRESVPENARKNDVMALMDKEIARIDASLRERFDKK